MSEWADQSECTCTCHTTAGVTHVVACCSGLPIDFWESEYDPYFIGRVSSKPRGRSSSYEPVEDWMSFINDKRTGKPLAGPGSERAV